MDCEEGMKGFPDGYFDLAVVDPPYGGGASQEQKNGLQGGSTEDWDKRKRGRFGGNFEKYHIDEETQQTKAPATLSAEEITVERSGGAWSAKYSHQGGDKKTDIRCWDVAPSQEYFNELARVSKAQIIWGGNYFDLPPTRCFLVWRKLTISDGFSMAMCEYAWTSFNDNAKWIELAPQGTASEKRIHPTQKPIALYTWICQHYTKPGFKILDTHVGSASSLIAFHRAGLDFVGFEKDAVYYRQASERLAAERAQLRMF